ncbi:hypothetical protein [Marinobacter sp. ANT_B65]|uniref:hypothetical protein n=1 Tax=Marinobacter sp. ANT_B65 TaxID=2039467 RepID=UPI00117CF5EC|nr:hypothetical protein [Marinobacter sp. ANT_B65]
MNYARSQPLSIEEFEHLLALKPTALLEKVGLLASKSLVHLINWIKLSPLLIWELEDVVKVLERVNSRQALYVLLNNDIQRG